MDAGGEIADSGVLQQLASRLGFLEQTRAEFDDPQRGLAPGDDGVDTRCGQTPQFPSQLSQAA